MRIINGKCRHFIYKINERCFCYYKHNYMVVEILIGRVPKVFMPKLYPADHKEGDLLHTPTSLLILMILTTLVDRLQ
ncbi:hypothetical protein CS542_00855 [Pedobacter sp. IW39]|nr:hypothetical protein CS542_00855 [Pedobacter sp. IW39]